MWTPLPSIRVLKTLRRTRKGKAQREQYLLAVGLCCYKWYQIQTLGGVSARMLGPETGWIVRSHIDWREGVPAGTLSPERGWIVRSHIGWRGEQNIPYKGVGTSP